jgi:hypothetical protein
VIEYYFLTPLQMDAIARALRIAFDNKRLFMQTMSATNRDLAMIDAVHQDLKDLSECGAVVRGECFFKLNFAEFQKQALEKVYAFALAESFKIQPGENDVHGIIYRNFPDFSKRTKSRIDGVFLVPHGPRHPEDPV